jgi:hypothetical protein
LEQAILKYIQDVFAITSCHFFYDSSAELSSRASPTRFTLAGGRQASMLAWRYLVGVIVVIVLLYILLRLV